MLLAPTEKDNKLDQNHHAHWDNGEIAYSVLKFYRKVVSRVEPETVFSRIVGISVPGQSAWVTTIYVWGKLSYHRKH